MIISKTKQTLLNRLSTYSGDSFSICEDIYKLISAADENEKIELFACACENFARIDTDKSYCVKTQISKSEIDSLEEQYGQTVNNLLVTYIKQCIDSEKDEKYFYSTIWNDVICSSIFNNEIAKIFATYYILIDKRIPFFKISKGFSMDNDTYASHIDSIKNSIERIEFILSYDFEQKTQEASNLLDEILSQKSYEDQVVATSVIINNLRSKIKKLQQIIKKSESKN